MHAIGANPPVQTDHAEHMVHSAGASSGAKVSHGVHTIGSNITDQHARRARQPKPNPKLKPDKVHEEKKKPVHANAQALNLVGPVGFEPTTNGLRVRCSTN